MYSLPASRRRTVSDTTSFTVPIRLIPDTRKRSNREWEIIVERVYRAVDQEIGEMLDVAGPNTRVMVFAAHGMGPLRHASWNLPEILDCLANGERPASVGAAPRKASVNPWRWLKMTVPGAVQYWIKDHLPQAGQDFLLFRWYSGGKDWRRCRMFAIPNNDSVGAIRFSVKGRDRFGQIRARRRIRSCVP